MESLFNIFGSRQHTVQFHTPVSSASLKEVSSLKAKARNEIKGVHDKKVLGDVGNTLLSKAKKCEAKENKLKKHIQAGIPTVKPTETPAAARSGLQLNCPPLADVHKSCNVSPKEEADFPTPEYQAIGPEIEDDYEDIWPHRERPTLEDYGRIMDFWSGVQELHEGERPESPLWQSHCIPEPDTDTGTDLLLTVLDSMPVPELISVLLD